MIITCESSNPIASTHYVPIPLGNGDLSVPIDFEGGQEQSRQPLLEARILRAGARQLQSVGDLVSFGHFEFDRDTKAPLQHWRQSIDLASGVVASRVSYADNVILESESFCSPTQNVLVLSRRYSGPFHAWRFRYFLGGNHVEADWSECGILRYRIAGISRYNHGEIRFSSSQPLIFEYIDGVISAWCEQPDAIIFIHFSECCQGTIKANFEELLATNQSYWSTFWATTPLAEVPEELKKTYALSLYHLTISATRWAVPIGLFNTHWSGRYFAFDEYFIFQGLLSSGRQEEARRIVAFRFAGLDVALNRAGRYFGKTDGAARYPWETIEDGQEGGGAGNPLDHIFQMANVALTSWDFYCYTQNRNELATILYPVIRACAEFYLQQAIYSDESGNHYIGKFLDLERLGSARDHAFMTTCAVIATLNTAARSAAELDCDGVFQRQCIREAELLTASLPQENSKFVAYPGCRENSIGLCTGLYPYAVLSPDHPKQRQAIDEFIANLSDAGNMYPVGNGLCTWYAGMLAMTLWKLGRQSEAKNLLRKMVESTGCFNEIFEIFEMRLRPYFGTAEGIFLQAVNVIYALNQKSSH